jgi:hypothetical protein
VANLESPGANVNHFVPENSAFSALSPQNPRLFCHFAHLDQPEANISRANGRTAVNSAGAVSCHLKSRTSE